MQLIRGSWGFTVTSPRMDTAKNIEHSPCLSGCTPIGTNPWKERRKEWKSIAGRENSLSQECVFKYHSIVGITNNSTPLE